MGASRYFTVTLEGSGRLRDLLAHLYVLVPVLDREKHYWVGEKGACLRAGRRRKAAAVDREARRAPHLPLSARHRSWARDPGGAPEADGEVWHLPAAEPVTAQEFFDLVFEAAGRPTPAKAQIAGPALLAVGGIFSPMLRELRETAYQFRRPFVIDSSKFERAFGRFEPTPHREAVERTVAWFRSR